MKLGEEKFSIGQKVRLIGTKAVTSLHDGRVHDTVNMALTSGRASMGMLLTIKNYVSKSMTEYDVDFVFVEEFEFGISVDNLVIGGKTTCNSVKKELYGASLSINEKGHIIINNSKRLMSIDYQLKIQKLK